MRPRDSLAAKAHHARERRHMPRATTAVTGITDVAERHARLHAKRVTRSQDTRGKLAPSPDAESVVCTLLVCFMGAVEELVPPADRPRAGRPTGDGASQCCRGHVVSWTNRKASSGNYTSGIVGQEARARHRQLLYRLRGASRKAGLLISARASGIREAAAARGAISFASWRRTARDLGKRRRHLRPPSTSDHTKEDGRRLPRELARRSALRELRDTAYEDPGGSCAARRTAR